MNQNDLNRAVAKATGESVSMIKRIGFLISEPTQPFDDPADPIHGGRTIDWDDYHLVREEIDDGSLHGEAALS